LDISAEELNAAKARRKQDEIELNKREGYYQKVKKPRKKRGKKQANEDDEAEEKAGEKQNCK
jgi:hypothetical protein